VSSSARISLPPVSGASAAEVRLQAAQPDAVHRLDATTAPIGASSTPASAALARLGQIQAVALAQPQTVAAELVFSAPGQSPGDSGDGQPGQQRPATPTEQRAEGQGSAAHAKCSSALPAPRMPAPAQDDGYTRHRDTDQPAEHWDGERGEFVQATGPPTIAHSHTQHFHHQQNNEPPPRQRATRP
jgi:hypothetical protein